MKKFIALLSLTLTFSVMADTNFACLGTEPFWGLTVEGSNATFTSASDATQTTETALITTVAGNTVVTTESAKATIIAGECNDGMSDNVYSSSIEYKIGASTLYGCCNKIK